MTKNGKEDSSRLFWIVLVGIILYAVLDVVAQILPPHYNPISQAESDLAVGKFGLIMTINFVNSGVLSLVFIFTFLRTLDLMGNRSHIRATHYNNHGTSYTDAPLSQFKKAKENGRAEKALIKLTNICISFLFLY